MRCLSALAVGLAGLGSLVAAACNGHDDLCNRKFSDVSMVGSHNAAFVGIGPSHNQYVSVTRQLDMGVRFLQARTQNKGGHPQMCHSSCWLLDAGPLEQFLDEVGDWLDGHPDEVLTLLLTNNDGLPLSKFKEAFESTGLDEHAFRPSGRLAKNDWPTLQQLINDGKRLIVFLDQGADTASVDYILPQWDYYWETPFGETDASFPTCRMDRPSNGSADRLMMIVNHFLNIEIPLVKIKIPDQIRASRTNSFASISAQVDLCRSQWDKTASIILLDWIDVGDAIRAQNHINGL